MSLDNVVGSESDQTKRRDIQKDIEQLYYGSLFSEEESDEEEDGDFAKQLIGSAKEFLEERKKKKLQKMM